MRVEPVMGSEIPVLPSPVCLVNWEESPHCCICSCLGLGLPACRTVKNTFMLLTSPQSVVVAIRTVPGGEGTGESLRNTKLVRTPPNSQGLPALPSRLQTLPCRATLSSFSWSGNHLPITANFQGSLHGMEGRLRVHRKARIGSRHRRPGALSSSLMQEHMTAWI